MNKLQNYLQKVVVFILFILFFNTNAQINFSDYFHNRTLRFDYINGGNASMSNIYFAQLREEPYWGGSHKKLIDEYNFGIYLCMVYDSATSKLIYSKSYSTLFSEWQTTQEAKTKDRSFYETVTIPYPKNTIRLEILKRNKQSRFDKAYSIHINPKDYYINKDYVPKFLAKKVLYSGNSNEKIDIVFLADGYAKAEMKKFANDVVRFQNYLFKYSPFKENKEKFNIWMIEIISEDTGTDLPGFEIWKRTALNSSFNTFGTERYLTTFDTKSIRDAAACVPYDQIVILVNSDKYGGGGFFNHYCITTVDHRMSEMVFIHEFGHSFGGLADEYYTSDVAYDNFYDLNIEPAEPNLTTMKHFELKWKDLVEKDTPIPTPSEEKYNDKVGVFEGGGYIAKGIFRPMISCIMKELETHQFCKVCNKAIENLIKFYSE